MEFKMIISEDKLEMAVSQMIVETITNNILRDEASWQKIEVRRGIKEGVDKAIKDYIYSKKDEIIERVIERASIEIVKKGLPKLLESLGKEANQ